MKRLPKNVDELRGLRAARWYRESTTGQFDNFGPDAQREQQDRGIARHGLIDTGLSWSVAASGWKSAWLTPGWSEMMVSAKRSEFDVLVVGYQSRFLRNLKQTLIAVDDLHKAGVAVLVVDERVLSSDSDDWEALTREAQTAEAFSRKHSKRVGEGYAAKRRRSGVPGGNKAPFGFRRVDDGRTIERDPEQHAVVARCYDLAAAGMTDREVASATNLKKSHVAEVLTNPVYKGVLRTGEAFAGGATVDEATWERVQSQRAKASRRKPGRGTLRVYPLSYLLHCAACARRLTAHTDRFRHVDACEAFKAAKPDGLRYGGESYAAELYDQIVPAVLRHVATGADLLPEVMAELERAETGPDPSTEARFAREKEAAMRKLAKDRDAFTFNETMARLDQQEAQAKATTRTLPSADEAAAFLNDLPRLYEASGTAERKLLTHALFERIDVLGVESVTISLTQEAKDHGWLEAWAGTELEIPLSGLRYGRGERI